MCVLLFFFYFIEENFPTRSFSSENKKRKLFWKKCKRESEKESEIVCEIIDELNFSSVDFLFNVEEVKLWGKLMLRVLYYYKNWIKETTQWNENAKDQKTLIFITLKEESFSMFFMYLLQCFAISFKDDDDVILLFIGRIFHRQSSIVLNFQKYIFTCFILGKIFFLPSSPFPPLSK